MAVGLSAGLAGVLDEPILGEAKDHHVAFLFFRESLQMHGIAGQPAEHTLAIGREAFRARDPGLAHIKDGEQVIPMALFT
jgi:hypothetical protein